MADHAHEFTRQYALAADATDHLQQYRQHFLFPRKAGREALYFTGNSLGLQPVKARRIIEEELDDWAEYGVDGHTESRRPWLHYHEFFAEGLAHIVGAHPTEVVAMNGLTTNLHLLLVSFYQPKGKRTKILCESKAFPSDQYALKSQLRFHGLDESHLIELPINPKTQLIDEEEIKRILNEHGDEIAVMMIGGVNYYTGQFFDMEKITRQARAKGITVGWDLAHAAGNVPLQLHDWDVDFAAWCSYKYLNSGPGAVSGIFIHERHHGSKDIPRFEGWWGHDKASRFAMPEQFVPIPTAEAWQLSNAPVFSMAPLLASLELFQKAGIEELHQKSLRLTAYLEFVIDEVARRHEVPLEIFTPREPARRGCQISLNAGKKGRELFNYLSEQGVVADWREPDVIRLAPVPLYNSFTDVYELGEALNTYFEKH